MRDAPGQHEWRPAGAFWMTTSDTSRHRPRATRARSPLRGLAVEGSTVAEDTDVLLDTALTVLHLGGSVGERRGIPIASNADNRGHFCHVAAVMGQTRLELRACLIDKEATPERSSNKAIPRDLDRIA